MRSIIVNKKNYDENKENVVNVLHIFYPDDQININDIFKTLQNEGAFYCFLIDDNNEVVSYCRGVKVWNRKTFFVIRQVETLDKYKGKGYAGKCYKAAEDYISKFYSNTKKIIAFVDNENHSSVRFHEKNGYILNDKASEYLRTLYGWKSAFMFEKNVNFPFKISENNKTDNNERIL